MRMRQKNNETEWSISGSYVEIYNEEIYDLLNYDGFSNTVNFRTRKENAASLRDDKDGSIMICGIKEERIESEEELFILLERGARKRATGATLMNDESSRSHAIFTIQMEQKTMVVNPETGKTTEDYVCSKFRFVDLAGSER